ncbi:phosphate acetyltransferase [Candidatus Woesearchaeota archaeon]|nr:phosphate acetyltransferase [Candidatus Woesearchaeota archaeon]
MVKRIFDIIKEKARADKKRIVFPESTEPRILQACERIYREGIAVPILIGNPDEIQAKTKELDLALGNIGIVNPANFTDYKRYANELYSLRKEKGMSIEEAHKTLQDYTYFGTMMVHLGDADGLVSGSVHSTGDTVRPALQIIKTKEKYHKVSGLFLMILKDKTYLFADCAVTINPSAQELAEIAIDSEKTAKKFGITPKVAMLSFSTKGSAKHEFVDKVIEATNIVKKRCPDLIVDGEMQVDAAIVERVCMTKCPGCALKGDANVLIFPDLQAGNIAYKLVERIAKAHAVGPILQGLRKPVNDLSRGCSVQDIIDVTAITAVEAQGEQE